MLQAPRVTDLGGSHVCSTVGATYDEKTHGALAMKSFETHLGTAYGSWAKDLAGNKIPKVPDNSLEKNTSSPWSNAWNDTILMLHEKTKTLIQLSRKWPDEGFGGKRCVKQLFEILVLRKYVKQACETIKNGLCEQHNIQKRKLYTIVANLSIDQDNQMVDLLSTEVEHLSSEYKRLTQNVDEITRSIINDFFTNTVKTNTIKQERHQIVVQTFVDNPTVQKFEELCDQFARTNWKWFVYEQSQGLNDYCESRGIDLQDSSEDSNEYSTTGKRRRTNHSDMEKRRIKEKTGCKCVGLPNGLGTCSSSARAVSPKLLHHEHRVPLSLEGQTVLQMSLEHDKNRWGMCGDCHTKKTQYIDSKIKQRKDDLQFMENYVYNYTLPQKLIEEIKLNMRMDEPETTKPIPYNYAVQSIDATGDTDRCEAV